MYALIGSRDEAKKYINKAFKKGFLATYRGALLKEKVWHFKRDKSIKSLFGILKGLFRYIFPNNAYKNYLERKIISMHKILFQIATTILESL